VAGDPEPSTKLDEQQTRVAEWWRSSRGEFPLITQMRTGGAAGDLAASAVAPIGTGETRSQSTGDISKLKGMDDAELMEAQDALAGLEWIGSIARENGSKADRYSFPNQRDKDPS